MRKKSKNIFFEKKSNKNLNKKNPTKINFFRGKCSNFFRENCRFLKTKNRKYFFEKIFQQNIFSFPKLFFFGRKKKLGNFSDH